MSANLNERQKALLKTVIEAYIDSAEPVGSKFLTEQGAFDVSGATLRNEMRVLEEQGYLTHPHTSAGRVPTELGYRVYTTELMSPQAFSKKAQKELEEALKNYEGTQRAKELAKYISHYTGSAVIMAHHPDSLYYTGLSQLFAQPELLEQAHALNISTMFDQCEERMAILYRLVNEPTQVFIGSENPLGAACGTVVCRVGPGLIAIIGPMRMNYAKVIGLSTYLVQS
jgi:heat-inducible transcriptional repressor